MNNKFLKGFLTGVASTILVVCLVLMVFSVGKNYNALLNKNLEQKSTEVAPEKQIVNKIQTLKTYINEFYLEEVEEDVYADGIYKGILASLKDPYSVYYTKKEYSAMMESSSGVYCGIGATVSQDASTGVISIVKPFVEGPAYEAGVLPGDIIYKVNGEEVTGTDLTEVVSKMKGEEGTQVEMSLVREGEMEPLDVTVTRKIIEVPTIESEMLKDDIGYIAISEFDEVTSEQFIKAIDDLETQGMEGLIIDLRNNGGGRLDTVVKMLDRILPEGTIVYTKDKNGEGEKFPSTDEEQFTKPLAVLINGNSASASEVFAGAVQDYKLGTLVGTTSFGKGIVQSVIPLRDGTAIKLTTSKYYTPAGRNIHETGIDPDVEVELDEKLRKQVVISKDEDNQLQEAIKVVKKQIK